MKNIILLLIAFAFASSLNAQSGAVFQTLPAYKLPDVATTYKAWFLCSDTSRTRYGMVSSGTWQQEGYLTIGGDVWTPIYMTIKKKPMPKNVIVWMAYWSGAIK